MKTKISSVLAQSVCACTREGVSNGINKLVKKREKSLGVSTLGAGCFGDARTLQRLNRMHEAGVLCVSHRVQVGSATRQLHPVHAAAVTAATVSE
ncbi:unnamed protein product [Protopolystoma xenopodis]|uniref:Uncharacterized protein n=1 Tax=Protopolystoma xenopodis TaxID=117903 RepID=A0A3S5ADC5_9PLAT|nr:unnamed protein product [Protopolystoma xenopodis]